MNLRPLSDKLIVEPIEPEGITAGGIDVTSSLVMIGGDPVDREISPGSERDLDFIWLLHKQGSKSDSLDRERNIYKSLCIPFAVIESFQLFLGQTDISGMVTGEHHHFFLHTIALQSHSVFSKGIIYVRIDLILLQVMLHQLAHNVKYFGIAACIVEITRISHDGHIEAGGNLIIHRVFSEYLLKEQIDHLTHRASPAFTDINISKPDRVFMMIDKHFSCF